MSGSASGMYRAVNRIDEVLSIMQLRNMGDQVTAHGKEQINKTSGNSRIL